jgi:hypothetical protein
MAPWSFAVITDFHVGFDSGLVDSDGDALAVEIDYDNLSTQKDNIITENLENSVRTIIANKANYNIMFVAVLGDISDRAEEAAFAKAKELLEPLNDSGVPYLPLVGNHDTWTYTQDTGPHRPFGWRSSASDRSHHASIESYANGDQKFKSVLWDNNFDNLALIGNLLPSFSRNSSASNIEVKTIDKLGAEFNSQTQGSNKYQDFKKNVDRPGLVYYLQNWGFVYDGIPFIGLDLAPRVALDGYPSEGSARPGDPRGAFATDHSESIQFSRDYYRYHGGDPVVILSHYATDPLGIDTYLAEQTLVP